MLIVLGIDGLDYDYAIDLNLTNLKQEQFGRLEVPISDSKGVPNSPEVWSMFLTGEISANEFERPSLIDKTLSFLVHIRKYIPLSLGLGKRVRRKGFVRFPPLTRDSFFKGYVTEFVNAPFYNYDHKTFELMKAFDYDMFDSKELMSRLATLLSFRKSEFLLKLKQRHDSLEAMFFYTHVLDTMQHVVGRKKSISYYLELEEFFENFVRYCDSKDTIIVVSDHGFNDEKMTHSNFAFYSCNKKINPVPTHIKDFYGMFLG